MRKRLVFAAGVIALAVLLTLVVWQGSFSFGDYGPASPAETSLYWAISTLVFLLTVTLAFMLFRTVVKLYIERRTDKEGSRIRTKLVVGALALTFLPVIFLVVWSVYVLNRNLDKWFSRPAEGIKINLVEAGRLLDREVEQRVRAQASLLASRPETKSHVEMGDNNPKFFERFCREQGIETAAVQRADGSRLLLCGFWAPAAGAPDSALEVRVPLPWARESSELRLRAPRPPGLARMQAEIDGYVRAYDRLALDRKSTRNFYLLLLALITLFILFVATWIALFLARQISIPISALLTASGEVSRGNLGYRVDVQAIDELASLVRGFNEMTRELEANSRELERRRRFTEAVLESIPTGVLSLAPDGKILMVNGALKQMFSEERVVRPERLEELFTREVAADIKHLMKRARRTGVASTQMEMSTGRRTMNLSVTVSALEAKLTSGFVVVLEDTSELLRAQKADAWHEVARRLAHEIKNPLTPIALSAERIGRQVDRLSAPPEFSEIVRECVATIVQEVDSLKALLNEFSQFARFPAAKPVPSDLNEAVELGLGVFSGRLDGIEVHRKLAPNLPPVNIDREQFKRVVVNLVDNAAEAMRESPVKCLYVATQTATAETIELIVADTGCGISPEAKEKLFLPYFSTKGRGTGLGLAIVSHILSDHHAHIRVEDNFPAGARFTVEIPVLTVAEAEPKPAEASA